MDLIAYIDGGSRGNPGPAATGVVVYDSQGTLLYEEGKAIGTATNNEAEYRALIRLMELCVIDPVIAESGAKALKVHSDSKLMVEQVTGHWKIKEPRLQELFGELQKAKRKVPFKLRIKSVPREENKYADKLVNQALKMILKTIDSKQTNNTDSREYNEF